MASAPIGPFAQGGWTSVNAPIGNDTQDKTAGTTIVGTVEASRAIAVGDVVIVAVAKDETGTGTTDGDQNEITGVTDSAGNVYTKVAEFANVGTAAAGDGCVIALFYTQATVALPAGGTITATFSASTTAKAMVTRKFTVGAGSTVSVVATATLANDAADPGSMDLAVANVEHLWVRAIAFEIQRVGILTRTAGFISGFDEPTTTGGVAETNIHVAGEFRAFTGPSNPSNPTQASITADCASIYAAFREYTRPVAQYRNFPKHNIRAAAMAGLFP